MSVSSLPDAERRLYNITFLRTLLFMNQLVGLQVVIFRGSHCISCSFKHNTGRRLAITAHSMAEKADHVRQNCIFCRICDGTEPNSSDNLLFSSENLVVFRDIKPAAKHHYLVVTREHIPDAKCLTSEQKPLLQSMLDVAKQVLEEQGADMSDVRFGFHWPPFHSISHLHLHAISPTSDMGLISRMVFKPNSWWFVTSDYVLSRL